MALAELKLTNETRQIPVFQNIAVAVDFSPASRRALQYALSLSAVHDSLLSIVHVLRADWRYEILLNPPELDMERTDAHQRLETLIADCAPQKKIDSIVLKHGQVSDTILSIADKSAADLLVMGTNGRGGLSKLALGSVAEELLRRSSCPVLTVGPKCGNPAASSPDFHTILFATDFGRASAKALPLALTLASSYGSKLVLLHMIPPMPAPSTNLTAYAPAASVADQVQGWEESCRKRALRELHECLPAETGLSLEPDYVVGTDFLPEGVLTAAADFKVDLIVMGATHTAVPRVAAHTPWTAVHEIVAHAPCPVMTVAG